ncbi:MAG: hypothetical protein K2J57_01505, partial [Bacteroidales bacterium]|nr:hypothetical protein [Bacteroidales bacterium]
MKEHVQEYGVRRWAGDDLVELQGEPLEAIQKMVEPYAPCIIQGCEVNAAEKRIGSGMVALWELDENNQKKGVKIARFAGCVTEKFPVYLSLKCTPEERVYVDGKNKPIAHNYTAQETTVENDVKDRFPLKITEDGGPCLPESLTVNFTAATARENIQPKETLGTAFGKIRKWFSDLKALAFKEKVSQSDFDDTLNTAFNNNINNTEAGLNGAINLLSESSVTPKDNDFYISQYANGGTSNKTYWRRRMSALWAYIKGKMSSDTGVNISGNAATATTATKATQDNDGNIIKNTYAKKTSLPTGVWRSNNGGKDSSSATTTLTAKQACTFTLKWLVSSERNYDKLTITAAGTTLVDAVNGESNGTIAETSLASGAAIVLTYSKDSSSQSGRDLGEISDFYITVNGVLIAITPFNIDTYFTVTHGAYFFSPVLNISAATTNLPGLMSATDKTKLESIATGANNYTHPTNTARTGYPTANQTPGFGATFTIGQVSNDANGHVNEITSRTVKIPATVATPNAAGLMSSADKRKEDGFNPIISTDINDTVS